MATITTNDLEGFEKFGVPAHEQFDHPKTIMPPRPKYGEKFKYEEAKKVQHLAGRPFIILDDTDVDNRKVAVALDDVPKAHQKAQENKKLYDENSEDYKTHTDWRQFVNLVCIDLDTTDRALRKSGQLEVKGIHTGVRG